MLREDMLKKGRNIGALLGAILYLVFGLIPAFYVSSHATLIFISQLIGRPVSSELLLRIMIITGTVFGLFISASLFVVLGAVCGTLVAFVIHESREFFRQLRGEIRDEKPLIILSKRQPLLSKKTKEEIEMEMGFLKPYLKDIHSIIVIGSTAYNINEDNSDIDMVIISKKKSFDRIRDTVFEHELEHSLKSEGKKKEFIVLEPDYTEELFKISSPFSFAIRYGMVLWDDGYLKDILKSYQESLPAPAYYFKAFYEYVAVQYYGALTKVEKDIKEKGCSINCCKEKKDCEGHKNVEILLKVILRMLYITLPARGYVPLTKKDLLLYVERIYGQKWTDTLKEIINITRLSDQTLYYDQYLRIKPLATGLFRETLEILGKKAEVMRVLRDAANMVRGNYMNIQDRAFRECVI